MADYDNKDTDLEKEIAEEGQIEAVREEEDSKEAERGEDSEKKSQRSLRKNMRMYALSAGAPRVRQEKCLSFRTTLPCVTTVCTKRWIR